MKAERLLMLDKNKLVEIILEKDEMLEVAESGQKGLEYVGRIFLNN